jgi:uncharacterized SAM-binding protein YcdF (DUF218 family)
VANPFSELLWASTEPMGLLGWAMVAALWASRGQAATRAWRGWLVLTTLYFLAGSPFVANALLHQWEGMPQRTCAPPPPGSVLVVLAGGIDGVVGDERDFERLKQATFRRAIAAIHLAKAAPGTTLLFSGGSGKAVREADVMRRLALELGVPADRILIERQSLNTFENARNTGQLIRQSHIAGPVYLVTSALHMPRAAATFAAAGTSVCAIAVDRRAIPVDDIGALVPQASALVKLTDYLHEVVGYLVYLLSKRI